MKGHGLEMSVRSGPPPSAAVPVCSYADVAAGGNSVPSSSSGSGESILQQCLLEALK